jgi:type IV secretion system protein VirB1
MDVMNCPSLAVPNVVMQHVVEVESAFNRYAIGVVGGRLQRQPHTLDEAVATARMLAARGYDFSVGLAQVNRHNLARFGLDSYAKAFDRCANLQAGARILGDCFTRARNDWGRAFSCYYSGNFITGFRDGYVAKVYASLRGDDVAVAPIRLRDRQSRRSTDVALPYHGRIAAGRAVGDPTTGPAASDGPATQPMQPLPDSAFVF